MRAFLEQYGIAIFILVIIGIMILLASGIGTTTENLITQEIKRFTDKSVNENKKILKDKEQYEILTGANQIYDGLGTMSFKIDCNISNIDKVIIDEKIVDERYYVKVESTSIIMLIEEYCQSLNTGTHTIKIVDKDNLYAISEFKIKRGEIPELSTLD